MGKKKQAAFNSGKEPVIKGGAANVNQSVAKGLKGSTRVPVGKRGRK